MLKFSTESRVLERLEAEKDSVTDRDSFTSKLDQVAKHDTSAKRFLKRFQAVITACRRKMPYFSTRAI